MGRFLLRLLVSAFALWLTTLLVSGVTIDAFGDGNLEYVLTLLVVALIFGLVNGVIGTFIRIIAFPLYVLTLGIIALFVNGLLLWMVAGISTLLGFGLVIDDYFWSGILGALVLGIITWILGLFLRPVVTA
ncbi:MAG: phage holin family protein [Microbacteriaceae bacterium]